MNPPCPTCSLPLAWLSGLLGQCQNQHSWTITGGSLERPELSPLKRPETKTPEELFLDEVGAREPWPPKNPHHFGKVPFALRPAVAEALREWVINRGTQEERARLVNAAKRNHNTAMQTRDAVEYVLTGARAYVLPAEYIERFKLALEDAQAAEAEARLQLETLRAWMGLSL